MATNNSFPTPPGLLTSVSTQPINLVYMRTVQGQDVVIFTTNDAGIVFELFLAWKEKNGADNGWDFSHLPNTVSVTNYIHDSTTSNSPHVVISDKHRMGLVDDDTSWWRRLWDWMRGR
jgi:hypothetical protein